MPGTPRAPGSSSPAGWHSLSPLFSDSGRYGSGSSHSRAGPGSPAQPHAGRPSWGRDCALGLPALWGQGGIAVCQGWRIWQCPLGPVPRASHFCLRGPRATPANPACVPAGPASLWMGQCWCRVRGGGEHQVSCVLLSLLVWLSVAWQKAVRRESWGHVPRRAGPWLEPESPSHPERQTGARPSDRILWGLESTQRWVLQRCQQQTQGPDLQPMS